MVGSRSMECISWVRCRGGGVVLPELLMSTACKAKQLPCLLHWLWTICAEDVGATSAQSFAGSVQRCGPWQTPCSACWPAAPADTPALSFLYPA